MSDLFLIATMAGRTVAIDSAQVDSVVDIGAVIPVPCADVQVRGLAALRSRVVTVLDPSPALGLPTGQESGSRAVITLCEGHYYALLVGELEDVAPFERAPLASGVVLDGGWARAGCGVIDVAGRPVLVVDLHALVPGASAAMAA